MDIIKFYKNRYVSKALKVSVLLRMIALFVYKKIQKRKAVAIVPDYIAKKYEMKEIQKLVRKNKRKDFFYLDGTKIDIIRPRV